jgi:hypothetical protein
MLMELLGFLWNFIDFYGFSRISWSQGTRSEHLWGTKGPGCTFYKSRFKIADSKPSGLKAWMPGCWQDWRDWRWVAAGWEEGIQGRPTRSTLQEVGGYVPACASVLAHAYVYVYSFAYVHVYCYALQVYVLMYVKIGTEYVCRSLQERETERERKRKK